MADIPIYDINNPGRPLAFIGVTGIPKASFAYLSNDRLTVHAKSKKTVLKKGDIGKVVKEIHLFDVAHTFSRNPFYKTLFKAVREVNPIMLSLDR